VIECSYRERQTNEKERERGWTDAGSGTDAGIDAGRDAGMDAGRSRGCQLTSPVACSFAMRQRDHGKQTTNENMPK
jgi:hypothetical protein